MQPTPWTIERHDSVVSTMDVARERAREGVEEPWQHWLRRAAKQSGDDGMHLADHPPG